MVAPLSRCQCRPGKPFTPKPLTGETELGRLLLALEIGCELEPCPLVKTQNLLAAEDAARERQEDLWATLPPCYRLLLAIWGHERCQHLDECDHGVTLEDWQALLVGYDGAGYRDPPLPETLAKRVSRFALGDAYRHRAGDGRHLYHPGDLDSVAWDGMATLAMPGKKQGKMAEELWHAEEEEEDFLFEQDADRWCIVWERRKRRA